MFYYWRLLYKSPTPVVRANWQSVLRFHTSTSYRIVHRANHYTILGVTPTATLSEVKSAFYKSSMQWHPDRNEGSEEAHKRFLKISEAYSVLSNEQRRSAYDRSLQIRTGSSSSGSMRKPHRYHNSAFSSSGEYNSAKRTQKPQTDNTSNYRRPDGTYTRYTNNGQRVKSNFEEWERKHYWEMKEKASNIERYARESSSNATYSSSQVSMLQFTEVVMVFTVAFGMAWVLANVVHTNEEKNILSDHHKHQRQR